MDRLREIGLRCKLPYKNRIETPESLHLLGVLFVIKSIFVLPTIMISNVNFFVNVNIRKGERFGEDEKYEKKLDGVLINVVLSVMRDERGLFFMPKNIGQRRCIF